MRIGAAAAICEAGALLIGASETDIKQGRNIDIMTCLCPHTRAGSDTPVLLLSRKP